MIRWISFITWCEAIMFRSFKEMMLISKITLYWVRYLVKPKSEKQTNYRITLPVLLGHPMFQKEHCNYIRVTYLPIDMRVGSKPTKFPAANSETSQSSGSGTPGSSKEDYKIIGPNYGMQGFGVYPVFHHYLLDAFARGTCKIFFFFMILPPKSDQ